MNTSIFHVRVSKNGDILVYASPMREVFTLPRTLRQAFLNNPDVVHWRRISTIHGLAAVRWALQGDFDFEIVNVRDYFPEDSPPALKGLRLSRKDGQQLIYLPLDAWPDDAAKILKHHPHIKDIVTPRFAGFCKGRSFPLATHVINRVQHIESEWAEPETRLPEDLRAAAKTALSPRKLAFEADYVL